MANQKPKKTPRTISMKTSIMFFALSLVINSLGNVLTLVSSSKVLPSFLGSAYWTAAETNLGIAFHWNLFWAFLILGVVITILNAILVGHWDWGRAIGNVIFMVPFSFLIQFFNNLFVGGDIFGIHMNPIVNIPVADGHAGDWWLIAIYILINFIGVAFIAIAISIYQRVNLVLHPADDLMQILRFKYFKGNAGRAMWASYIPPTIMAVIAYVMTRQFTFYGIGTIFAFLFQGNITGWADKMVFPRLKHQAVDVADGDEPIIVEKIDSDIEAYDERHDHQ
ncbi:fructose permease [Fructilactobacillus ixorae]|uniref:Fructose permease n=1 Tax=Fructilactobacillus ixorae TaxID=1750535 RepID=A0ABY5C6Y1_9LACO|nr:fructose permease [Fructilactobacillus ixorae]USS93115.1 fructose permease [Fructilactobacillus ixorae]